MTYENLISFINLQDIKNIIGDKEVKFKVLTYVKELTPKFTQVSINITNGIIKENNKQVDRYLNEMDLKIIKKQIN